ESLLQFYHQWGRDSLSRRLCERRGVAVSFGKCRSAARRSVKDRGPHSNRSTRPRGRVGEAQETARSPVPGVVRTTRRSRNSLIESVTFSSRRAREDLGAFVGRYSFHCGRPKLLRWFRGIPRENILPPDTVCYADAHFGRRAGFLALRPSPAIPLLLLGS